MLSASPEARVRHTLQPREVQVWQAPLLLDPATLAKAAATLDGRERERAASFRFESDRARFIAGRGWLRWLLGRYLALTPDQVEIEPDQNGKPFLAGNRGRDLWFNASNSGDLALYSFTRAGPVGVDLERVRDDFPVLLVADRFFSVAERRRLIELPAADRARAFFECWTRKEAYLKAVGVGLALPLDEFTVTFGAGIKAGLGSLTDRGLGSRWSVYPLSVAPGYEGCVVVGRRPSVAVQTHATICGEWME